MPTDPTFVGLARYPCGWRCRKRIRTKSSFKTTTSSWWSLSSFMQILRPSPPRFRGPSSTPQRAIPRKRYTMRLAAIATSWCGVMGRRIPRTQCSGALLLESLQKEESKINCVFADPKAMRTGWPSTQLRHATFVTNLSIATLFATTATSRENIEEQPITPATSSYG